MGVIYCTGVCFGCKRLFSFNPHRVPSIPINGMRGGILLLLYAQAGRREIQPRGGAVDDQAEQSMSDIVERLREDARGGKAYHALSDEAADEIERLKVLVRAAYNEGYDEGMNDERGGVPWQNSNARRALEGK